MNAGVETAVGMDVGSKSRLTCVPKPVPREYRSAPDYGLRETSAPRIPFRLLMMYEEKLLPHNLEAEEALLGSVLLDGGRLADLIGKIQGDDFYREANALIGNSFVELFKQRTPLDQVTVSHCLQAMGNLETVGGLGYLSYLVSETPTPIHAEYYIGIVKETSTLRKLIQHAAEVTAASYMGDNSQEIAESGVQTLLQLRTGNADRRPMSSRDLYNRYQAELIEEIQSDDSFVVGISTGFKTLDKIINGWQAGLFYVLGARTSMGKTMFAHELALKTAARGARCSSLVWSFHTRLS